MVARVEVLRMGINHSRHIMWLVKTAYVMLERIISNASASRCRWLSPTSCFVHVARVTQRSQSWPRQQLKWRTAADRLKWARWSNKTFERVSYPSRNVCLSVAERTYTERRFEEVWRRNRVQPISARLSMEMLFIWDSHGKRPMGWDGTAHSCIYYGTVAMS